MSFVHIQFYQNCILLLCTLTDEEVTAGKVTGVVTLGSVPYQQEYDLCDLVNYVDLSCPIPKGTLSIVMKMNVPDYAPPVS